MSIYDLLDLLGILFGRAVGGREGRAWVIRLIFTNKAVIVQKD